MMNLQHRTLVVLFSMCISALANALTITGNDIVDITAETRALSSFGNSTVNIYAPVLVVQAADQSVVNMFNGADSSSVDLFGSSELNIFDGTISFLTLYGSSSVHIRFVDLAWLRVMDGVEAHIYGTDFIQTADRLSGKWASGESFDFWALDHDGNGQVSVPVPGQFRPIPSSIILHDVSVVPIPASAWLFISAFGFFGWVRRRYG